MILAATVAEQGLSDRLLAWYDRNARALPWRASPGTVPDPYKVWLSEIMLQQTTVAAVKEYFLKFTEKWPTVEALASAPLDDILKAWAGLGYYARARNLHACARLVAGHHGGRFPETEAALRELPGIGPYTAGAIAAIAFNRRAAAVDGNVERVIARLGAIETPLPQAKPAIRDRVLELIPAERPGDFAQAMMDLGATICTPRAANCLICPWSEPCQARKRGLTDVLPLRAAKTAQPLRRGIAFWVERDGALLLRRRPDRGLLGGMMEVPSTPWASERPSRPLDSAPVEARWRRKAGRIEHTFTHFHLELEIWRAEERIGHELRGDGDYRWVPMAGLAGEALPSVMRKIVGAMTRA
ncbi:MAG: A/G-specific adenine glycosylase [Rhizobiales bacterium]|nr:A/G-specific adenine glycosylase [Hyphomicrobiales bacterium]